MPSSSPYVVSDADLFAPDEVFLDGRAQVVVGVLVTPVFGQVDLGLLAVVVDEADARGWRLVRESPLKDEVLLCVFEPRTEPAGRSSPAARRATGRP